MRKRGQYKFPEHGTTAGYRAHLRHLTQPCEACKEANRELSRARRSERVICVDCGRDMKLEAANRCVQCYRNNLKAKRTTARRKREDSDGVGQGAGL